MSRCNKVVQGRNINRYKRKKQKEEIGKKNLLAGVDLV